VRAKDRHRDRADGPELPTETEPPLETNPGIVVVTLSTMLLIMCRPLRPTGVGAT
jgi:hypothetical protein